MHLTMITMLIAREMPIIGNGDDEDDNDDSDDAMVRVGPGLVHAVQVDEGGHGKDDDEDRNGDDDDWK